MDSRQTFLDASLPKGKRAAALARARQKFARMRQEAEEAEATE